MKEQNLGKTLFKFLIIFSFYFGNVFSSEDAVEAKSRQEILQVLQKWPHDFNAKNIEATCGLFAPDLIASYQGSADKNYKEMCRSLTTALTNSHQVFSYEVPNIEQILIYGDVSVVRLIWTLKISSQNPLKTELIKEKGLDIFKRQKDGSWKIAISYAYPITD